MPIRRALPTTGRHVALLAAAAFAALPLVWGVKSALTPTPEVLGTGLFSAPTHWTWDNLTGGWQSGAWPRYVTNSLVVALTVTATTVAASATAGYGFAKFAFRGRSALFVAVLACLMMPFQAIMIPLFVEVRTLGWLGSLQGLIIPGAVSAFGVFMTRQFMAGLPDELLEAARLDGCGEWRLFRRIVLPLARAPLSALGALTFLASWNNFLWPLIVVQDDNTMTVPLGLANFRGAYGTDYGQILALSVVAAVPVVAVYLLMRRRIVASFATSGLK